MATKTKKPKTEPAADRYITHSHGHRHPGLKLAGAYRSDGYWEVEPTEFHGHWHRHDAREQEDHRHDALHDAKQGNGLYVNGLPHPDSAVEDATGSAWLMERKRDKNGALERA